MRTINLNEYNNDKNNNNNKNNKKKKFNFEKLKDIDFDKIKEIITVKYKRISIMTLIALVLFLALLVESRLCSSSEKKAVAEYNQYLSLVLASKSDRSDTVRTVIIPSDSAVDVNKINKDIEQAEAYIKKWFSFSNGDEYDAIRQNLIDTFGEDHELVKNVFVVNTRNDVTHESYVDVFGINMKVLDMKTYPIKINDNGNNEYMSIVSIETRNKDKNVVGQYFTLLTYTFNESDIIIDMKQYELSIRY